MYKIGLFYAVAHGSTEAVSKIVRDELEKNDFEVDLYNISESNLETLISYDFLIMATSTWNFGGLPDDWEEVYDDLFELDFSGKTVALIGLGDQIGFPRFFADGVGLLSMPIEMNNGRIVGRWSANGYTFEKSKSFNNGYFIGLVIDQENQPNLTEHRIEAWVNQIKDELHA